MPKGMLAYIYRNADWMNTDTTNGGVSNKATRVIIVGKGIPEISEPSEDLPALQVVERTHFNDYIAVPNDYYQLVNNDEGAYFTSPMFGGNFVYTSDSRLPTNLPIPIHDRFEDEAKEHYERYESLLK